MTCEEARVRIGADPEDASPELLTHLQTCTACQVYREQMLALNAKIRRALELDLPKVQVAPPSAPAAPSDPALGPAGSSSGGPSSGPAAAPAASPPGDQSNVVVLPRPAPPAPVRRHKRPGLFAFAAGIAAALVVGLTLWLSRPSESLADEIVKHVDDEPGSWHQTQPVTNAELNAVLRKSGIKLGPGMQPVVYASSCWFRGHFVPHLVVMTPEGPVTVMILVNEKATGPQKFDDEGYSGLLVPAPIGSVAVLSRAPMPLDLPASNVVQALRSAT